MVSSLDDIDLLVHTAAVPLLPSQHVDVFFFVIFLLLLFPTVYIDVIAVFYLSLLGEVDSGQRLWLVFERSQLLVGHVVELQSGSVLSFSVQEFRKHLLDLLRFHWHEIILTFALE